MLFHMPADSHRQRIVNWINATGGTSSAFDVTTKVVLVISLADFLLLVIFSILIFFDICLTSRQMQ